jgi:hypothetical protein
MEDLSQDSHSPGQDLIKAPLEYESEILPLHQPAQFCFLGHFLLYIHSVTKVYILNHLAQHNFH